MNRDYHDLPYGITCIDTHYNRPQMAASFLLVEQGKAAFIETGPLLAVPRLMEGLKRVGLKPQDVEAVIVTHVHLDHAGGAGELMRCCPSAKLYVHEAGADHMIDPTKLKASAMAVYGEELFKAALGDIIPTPEERVVKPGDGETLSIGGRVLHFYDTPGHARHHFCVWDPTSQGLFTGDAFGISYREFDGGSRPFIFPPTTPVQLDPERFHQSLDRLAALKPKWLYLTHFGALPYQPEFLSSLHTQLDQYVAMAKKARIQGVSNHQQLLSDLRKQALTALKELNAPIDNTLAVTLLASDQEINAQGLEVWLDRLEKHKGK
ncbi:MAG: MBL fold metallo-hydrolase [Magnetococcales bacterium]|nr:MBL fold metallo-hydrolase [Magnetococcales bacterium]